MGKNAETHNEILKINTNKNLTNFKKLDTGKKYHQRDRFPFSQTTDVGTTILVEQFNHKLLNVHTLTQQFFP